jgi:hypothetical protein
MRRPRVPKTQRPADAIPDNAERHSDVDRGCEDCRRVHGRRGIAVPVRVICTGALPDPVPLSVPESVDVKAPPDCSHISTCHVSPRASVPDEPHRVLDDVGRKAMAFKFVGASTHSHILTQRQLIWHYQRGA